MILMYSAALRVSLPRLALLVFTLVGVLGCFSASALAASGWQLVSMSNTTVRAGDQLDYYIEAVNRTDASSDGSAYTITINLPSGMTGVSFQDLSFSGFDCGSVAGLTVITCTSSNTAAPAQRQRVVVTAAVDPGASGVRTARLSVTGGGLADDATADPVTISSAAPTFGVDAFDGQVSDVNGTPDTQAGGHPSRLATQLDFNTFTDLSPTSTANLSQSVIGPNQPVEPVKDVVVDLPPGLVGNPTAVEQCASGELSNTTGLVPTPLCPPTSQVGTVLFVENGGKSTGNLLGPYPVFNMVPPPGVPARFGINVVGTIVVLDASVRTGSDYGLAVTSRNAPAALPIIGVHFDFWGVPADSSHNGERSCSGQPAARTGGPSCTNDGSRAAFFRNPTSCEAEDTGLTTTVHTDSWFHPGDFKTASFVSHLDPGYPFSPLDPSTPWGDPIGPTNCEAVPFDPSFDAQPLAGSRAGGPASFAVDLSIPQSDNPDLPAQSDLRKAEITLPEGIHLNPSSAGGLGACAPADIALRSPSDPTCPESAKVGTMSIETPLLDATLTGGMYVATPHDNPFDCMVALYAVVRADGVVVKLPGQVSMDPLTGQITTTFDNNPQLPFSRLHVEFKTGPRAPLVIPNRCGRFVSHAVLTGWNGSVVERDSSFTITQNNKGQACPPQFTPGFDAGTKSNSAGSSSPFLMRITRSDEDQVLSGLSVHMARGLTGRIANVDLCTDAQARSNTCPASSQIGDVTVGAGAGSNPFFITNGRAFLTGPYKGAPFGASIVVPAVAGPFDLGTVTTRASVAVDKHDATVSIVSDPLPTILEGIPLDVRDIRVSINKPKFWLNPTSCSVKTISATLTSTEGTRANVSDRFQAADCASLRFRPRMTMRVGGRGHTHRGQTSGFTTTLRMPQRNQSNVKFVRVTLPKTINARLNTINDACTRSEFENDIAKCAHAKAGSARAVTPLLRAPLKGTVYFVKNGHPIPDLFVALRGQVDFDLIGRITIPGGTRLATTFDAAPDVPIRSFSLHLLGGARTASIGAAANLCSASSRRQKAQVDYIAQNGRVRQVAQALHVAGCAGRHRKR